MDMLRRDRNGSNYFSPQYGSGQADEFDRLISELPLDDEPSTPPQPGSETPHRPRFRARRQRRLTRRRQRLADQPRPSLVPQTGTEFEVEMALRELEWEGEVNRSSRDYGKWVQQSLNSIIGAHLVVDGIIGSMTKNAIRTFQRQHGLYADGIVGPITEGALIAAGASPPPGTAAPTFPSYTPTPSKVPGAQPRLSVPESVLISLLPMFVDYSYNLGQPRYPEPVPGVSATLLAPPQQTNCSCFAEALMYGAWHRQYGSAFQWNAELHNLMMIPADLSNPFSPITAVTQAGMATSIPDGSPPAPWSLVQGWRSFPTSGHAFIVVDYHAPSDRVLILEASSSFNGVGCRNFGNLHNLPGGRPPARWWEDSRAPTWRSNIAEFRYGLKMAKLGVTNLSWSGLR